MTQPKILVFDIETAPIEAYVWGLYDQNIALNQIKQDWTILAFGAKWYNDPVSKTIYEDNSRKRNVRDDKRLVKKLWELLNEANIVITQNGDAFDIKKFNARAAIHKLPPVGPIKSTDVMKESKKVFGFTSQSLEYTSEALNLKYKKLKHPKYPGMELWTEILKGNQDAWREMKTYCIHDVLSTEEKYQRIQGWVKTQNLACYFDDAEIRCRCGSRNLIKKGFVYTDTGKFQGYKCLDCGKRPHGRLNLFSAAKKIKLLKDRR